MVAQQEHLDLDDACELAGRYREWVRLTYILGRDYKTLRNAHSVRNHQICLEIEVPSIDEVGLARATVSLWVLLRSDLVRTHESNSATTMGGGKNSLVCANNGGQ